MTDSLDLESRLERLGIPRGGYVVRPLDRLRRLIANRMTETARDVPHFGLDTDVMLDALMAKRAEALAAGAKISVNDLVIKASGKALKAIPEVNASYMPDGLVLHEAADVAVAVAIKGGLMTPIVRNADAKPVEVIAEEMRDLAARAQTRRLAPDEHVGGTFSISNLGMFGVTRFGSILNPPHAAILSVGAAREHLALHEGELVASKVLTVTLTCDHRVLDGVTGARWLQAFRSAIETPQALFE